MSYLDRLKAQFPENCPAEALTKLTEAPFVSSVSTRVGQKKASDARSQQHPDLGLPGISGELIPRVLIPSDAEIKAGLRESLARIQAEERNAAMADLARVHAIQEAPPPAISPELAARPEDLASGDIAPEAVQAFDEAAIARDEAQREVQERQPAAKTTLPRLTPISEGRRQRVLAILAHVGGRYAVAVDAPWRHSDPVILVLATPAGTCELHLPRDRLDLPAVMKMVGGWNTADPCGGRGEIGAGSPLGGQEVLPGDHPLLVKPETEPQFRAWAWQSNRYDPKGHCGGTYLAPAGDGVDAVRAYLEKFFGVQITELRRPGGSVVRQGRSPGRMR